MKVPFPDPVSPLSEEGSASPPETRSRSGSKHEVFLSHSASDKAVADAVCAILERNQIRCWVAPRDILAGQNWGEAIVDAIKECRLMVVIFSAHSNSSKQVVREIEQAVKRGVTVLPFRIEDVPLSADMDYRDIRWKEITVSRVTFFHDTGGATVALDRVLPELQGRFGYQPTIRTNLVTTAPKSETR